MYADLSGRVVEFGKLAQCRELFKDGLSHAPPCLTTDSELFDDEVKELKGRSYTDLEDGEDVIWIVRDIAYHEEHDAVVAYIHHAETPVTCDDDCQYILAQELLDAPWAKWVERE